MNYPYLGCLTRFDPESLQPVVAWIERMCWHSLLKRDNPTNSAIKGGDVGFRASTQLTIHNPAKLLSQIAQFANFIYCQFPAQSPSILIYLSGSFNPWDRNDPRLANQPIERHLSRSFGVFVT